MTASPDWWKDFFSGLMVEFWKNAMTADATMADADFFEKRLSLAPGARVLDAPCGVGRFALALARRGCRATGVDLSADSLAAARAEAAAEGLSVAWRQSDMRDLPWRGEFDAVLCVGSSFGYFDDAGNAATLAAAARVLKPGGRLLLESGWIAESILPSFRETLEMDAGDLHFTAKNAYIPETGRVENVFSVTRGSQTVTRAASHRIYTLSEVLSLLRSAGFTRFECLGGTDGAPYRLGSHRLLLVAGMGG
jgi:ubiquinone/menaquinone biosynthesis C-methylase UbiE